MIALNQSESSRLVFITVPPAHHCPSFESSVVEGLQASPKTLPCRLFYDRRGSELFERICNLPEYYLTRAEQLILERSAAAIIKKSGDDVALVEFGSGSSSKTRILIEELLRTRSSVHYMPIDISCDFLEESARELLASYSGLHITAIAAEYRDAIAELSDIDNVHIDNIRGDNDHTSGRRHPKKLILFLGSNIGNFEKHEAVEFLSAVRSTMNDDDHILLGVDLLKRRDTLIAAYNDSLGVTSEFNKNLLLRINEDMGADFDLDGFEHSAPFVEEHSRIEMHLVSRRCQEVRIAAADITIDFQKGETIHTENSHKYSYSAIQDVARTSSLTVTGSWFDPAEQFAVLLLGPEASRA